MVVKSCLPLCCSSAQCFEQQRSEMRVDGRESEPCSPAPSSAFLTTGLLHKMKVLLPRVHHSSLVLRFILVSKGIYASIMNPTPTACSGAWEHQLFFYNLVLCQNMRNCFSDCLCFLISHLKYKELK